MGTVDVIYPGAPFFLYFNPSLLKAQLVPVLNYAESTHWKFPFAPHDLGVYPQANGQAYGGVEHSEAYQMSVEECGIMIPLTVAICKIENKTDLVDQHFTTLLNWVNYLLDFGLNPKNQLCTDDFTGHIAHNANLSLKVFLAIAAFAQLWDLKADKMQVKIFNKIAQTMAFEWLKLADDGDHYRRAFDRKGNNRAHYAKADWIVWTACLAEKKEVFQAFVNPLYDFLNVSESRVPFTDLYDTKTGEQVAFKARSVVGGVYLPLLITCSSTDGHT
ncbi:unnamed protein product [Rotaria sp. Silwood2]|nr:unnamed protein product [Rotaria sp. Silwood2]